LYLVRGLLARLRPLHVAGIALLLLVLSSWLVHAIAQALVALVVPGSVPPGWSLPRMAGLSLCVGLLGLAVFYHHWRANRVAVEAKHAHVEALQERVRPHFLGNAVSTGGALVRERAGEAGRRLGDLSHLFRAALAGPPTIPLEDELAVARCYLEMEQLRFGPRLQVKWEVPAVLPAVPVPTLSVQPLVENAIRHGIERSPRGGEVRIVVVSTGSGVRVTVSNSLPSAAGPATHGHQVGL